jgi:hypothetical protein
VNANRPVRLPAFLEEGPDENAELTILLVVPRDSAFSPRVKARLRDAERFAKPDDGKGLLRCDESKLHVLSFAKKAAAFFRIAFSISSSRTRLRSCWSSLRSSVVSVGA